MPLRQQQCFFNGQCKQPLTVNTILSPYCSLHLSYSPWGTRRGLFTNTTGITWPREPTSTRWESISRVKRDINLSTHFSNCGCLFFFEWGRHRVMAPAINLQFLLFIHSSHLFIQYSVCSLRCGKELGKRSYWPCPNTEQEIWWAFKTFYCVQFKYEFNSYWITVHLALSKEPRVLFFVSLSY